MKCPVIRDLLPLYAEDMCTDKTKTVVEEHLKNCDQCSELYNSMRQSLEIMHIYEDKTIADCGKDNERQRVLFRKYYGRLIIMGSALLIGIFALIALFWMVIGH